MYTGAYELSILGRRNRMCISLMMGMTMANYRKKYYATIAGFITVIQNLNHKFGC